MNNPNSANTKKIIAYGAVFVLLAACAVCAVLLGYKSADEKKPATLISTASADEAIDLKIKGNKSSRIYHLQGCPNYEDIAERNIVWLKTKEEAESKGFRMAKNCQ